MSDSAEAADRLSLRRVRAMTAVMILFAVQSAQAVADRPQRTVEFVALFGWLAMAMMLMLVLRTGGMWLRDPAVRALANDDVTRANRAEAAEWGFSAAILVAAVGVVTASLTAMPALFALRMVILVGLFTATMRFVRLERAALA